MNFGNKIITDGLILYLDAADKKSYPGSGNIWYDRTKNKYNGTLINYGKPPNAFDSANGGAIIFDGSNDYVNCGNLGSFFTQGALSFWFASTAVENYRNILSTNFEGGNTGIRFEQYTNPLPYGGFNATIGSGLSTYTSFDYSPTTSLTTNLWYEVVLIWNTSANNVIGYLNGVLKFNSPCSTWPSTIPSFSLGNGFDSGRYFMGRIASVKLYNKLLSSSEVSQNFNAQRKRFNI